MSTTRQASKKILSPAALARKLPTLRRRKKVVFTNGCFDLLHPGHTTYLEKARGLGDLLIVALNTDASVSKLKGPSRPINSLADRMQVIAALESVDFVTWFDSDTPLELILSLRPDWVTKGGDWKIDQIVGAREARAWGGRGKSLPFVADKSTTEIVKRIAK